MSFLQHIAARALSLPVAGVSPAAPKDRSLALRVPAADDAPEEDSAEAAGSEVARSIRREAVEAPAEDTEPEADPVEPEVRRTNPAGEPPPAGELQQDEEPVAREAWRAPADQPPADDEPSEAGEVSRAARPASQSPAEEPEELPEETAGESVPGRVLALRRAPTAAAPAPAAAAVAQMPPTAAVPDLFADDFAVVDDWRPADHDGYDTPFEPSPADPQMSGPAEGAGSHGFIAPPPKPVAPANDIVIEQIDVFVQEPAPREPSRPRLSDPSRLAAARYLRSL